MTAIVNSAIVKRRFIPSWLYKIFANWIWETRYQRGWLAAIITKDITAEVQAEINAL